MIPYSNPQPHVSQPSSVPAPAPRVVEPPTIQKTAPAQPQVRIQVPKPREDKKKYSTLALDQDLTQRVQDFADAQGLPNLNEGIRVLLRSALSSDAVLAAVGAGWQRGYWQGRQAFFEAANGFMEEQRKVILVLQREASLYTQANPIHIPGEQPPTW